MNFRGKNGEDAIVDLTPLIDVVFLLLIFFMVSTTFKAETRILVDLPKASAQAESAVEPLIILSLDRNGILEYKGNVLQLEELGDVLSTLTNNDKNRPILLRADQDSAHGLVVGVIDRARQSGFKKISIATRVGGQQTK